MVKHDSATTWSRRRVLASLAGVAAVAPFMRGERGGAGDSVLLRYTSHVPNSHGLYAKVFPAVGGDRRRADGRANPLGAFSLTDCFTGRSTGSRRWPQA